MVDLLKSLPEHYSISDYRIERVIGQGGFGITYLATDLTLMKEVAIKEYYPREFADRDSTLTIHAAGNREDKETFEWGLVRFLDEARILAKLNHPNIVSANRYFESNGTAYLVMEYCQGKPLDQIIKEDGPLNKVEFERILSPLLDGLEHVHSNDFLHRDIKPANIFIRKDGSPVLLDFGAARHEMTSHSRSVTSLATAGYAPFEQYSTNGKQGPWSDIYGLAATLYRALTGDKPQDAPDRMLEDHIVPLTVRLKGKFDFNVLDALDKAMSVRPDQRPQNIVNFRILLNSQGGASKNSIANIKPLADPQSLHSKLEHPKKYFSSISALAIVSLFGLGIIFLYNSYSIQSLDDKPVVIKKNSSEKSTDKSETDNSTKNLPVEISSEQLENSKMQEILAEQEQANGKKIAKAKELEQRRELETRDLEIKRREAATELASRQAEEQRRQSQLEAASALSLRQAEEQKQQSRQAINSILEEGETCFVAKRYDCSIASANAALRMNGQEARAENLKDRASVAQRRAIESISIK